MIPVRAALSRRLALLCLLVVAACGPLRRVPESERVTIAFSNESSFQVDLYAVTSSGSYRLGTVGPNRTQDIPLAESVVAASASGVNFVARVFPGRQQVQSGNLTLLRGERLQVRLPSTMNFLVVTPG